MPRGTASCCTARTSAMLPATIAAAPPGTVICASASCPAGTAGAVGTVGDCTTAPTMTSNIQSSLAQPSRSFPRGCTVTTSIREYPDAGAALIVTVSPASLVQSVEP